MPHTGVVNVTLMIDAAYRLFVTRLLNVQVRGINRCFNRYPPREAFTHILESTCRHIRGKHVQLRAAGGAGSGPHGRGSRLLVGAAQGTTWPHTAPRGRRTQQQELPLPWHSERVWHLLVAPRVSEPKLQQPAAAAASSTFTCTNTRSAARAQTARGCWQSRSLASTQNKLSCPRLPLRDSSWQRVANQT